MSEIEKKQPAWRRGNHMGKSNFRAGSNISVSRLAELKYDPIGELVVIAHQLKEEINYQEKLRSQEIVEFTPSGKPRAYRAETHHALYDKLINIGDKLLRYRYGRVPETVVLEEKKPTPLIVNLTAKGETYVVNDNFQDGDEYDDQERE